MLVMSWLRALNSVTFRYICLYERSVTERPKYSVSVVGFFFFENGTDLFIPVLFSSSTTVVASNLYLMLFTLVS